MIDKKSNFEKRTKVEKLLLLLIALLFMSMPFVIITWLITESFFYGKIVFSEIILIAFSIIWVMLIKQEREGRDE